MKTVNNFLLAMLTGFTLPGMAQNANINSDNSNSDNGLGTKAVYMAKPLSPKQDDSIAYRYANGSLNGTAGANSAFTFGSAARDGAKGAALANTAAFNANGYTGTTANTSRNSSGIGMVTTTENNGSNRKAVAYHTVGSTTANNNSEVTGIGDATPAGQHSNGGYASSYSISNGTGSTAHTIWWPWLGLLGLLGLFGLRHRHSTETKYAH